MDIKKNDQPLRRIVSFSAKFRIPIIIFVILITILFAFFAISKPGISFTSDLRTLIPKMEDNNKYNKERTNIDYMVVVVTAPDNKKELFTEKALSDLQLAIGQINLIENVKVAISPFEQITIKPSIRNNSVVSYKPLPILKKDFRSKTPFILKGSDSIKEFKNELLTNIFTKRLVINDNGTMLAFMIDHSGYKDAKGLPDKISLIMNDYSDSFSHSIAGQAVFTKFVSQYLKSDLFKLMGLGLLLSLVLFFFSFKSLRAVFLPASVTVISIIWMLGTMALAGMEITVVSIVGPPLILALGSSYCIHVLNQYYRASYNNSDLTKPVVVFKAISKINKTILMASVTTVIALFGLLLAKVSQTRSFAIATSFGILYSSILSLVFLPACLSLLKLPTKKNQKQVKEGFIAKALKTITPWIIKRKYFILVLFLIIALSPIVSAKYISYKSDYISYFPQDNPAVIQTSVISKELSGVTQLFIDYHINEEKYKKYVEKQKLELGHDMSTSTTFYHDYEALTTIANFEKDLKKDNNVRYILSFPLVLCETNKVITEKYEIPKELKQRLKLNSVFNVLRARKNSQFQLINPTADTITTAFRLTDLNYSHGYIMDDDLKVFVQKLDKELKVAMPEYIDYQIAGNRLDYLNLRDIMNRDLKITTLFSILLIFLTLSLVFRNALYGFFSIIPMISGITLNFTIMAIAQIPLDMTTIMVSCVAIGIGVDDSAHFLLKFNALFTKYKNDPNRFKKSLQETMELTGRPIILTSISIILGMGMLIFATFPPIAYLGFLISLALFTTTIGCLLFLPMSLSIHNKIRTLILKRKETSSN